MKLKRKYSAGLVIIYRGKILLGHTAGRKNNTGWGIPKGGIEKGESNLDAAIRETYEELGIKVNRKLVDKRERTFVVTSRKYNYNKVVYYYVVNIDDLSQIGLKSEIISKGKLQLEEIDDARFFTRGEAEDVIMQSQKTILTTLVGNGLLEAETIAKLDVEPNQEINATLEGDGEDPRLVKIRQFKGTVKNYKDYWDDRISKGNSSTIN